MYRQYFRQALQMLKESPFFSVITILGTALAICMIMVMVIVFEIQNKGFKPGSDALCEGRGDHA